MFTSKYVQLVVSKEVKIGEVRHDSGHVVLSIDSAHSPCK